MNELDGGGYEGTAAEQIPSADSSSEPNGSQEHAAGNTAGEESGELRTRDEYADHMDHDTAVGDAPEHIEEADLAAIDAYDSAHDQAAPRAQTQSPGEALGGTLAERDTDTPKAEDASSPHADHAETKEAVTERIGALEAENADVKQQLADLKARQDRFDQLFAGPEWPPGSDAIEGTEDKSARKADQLESTDVATGAHSATMVEREGTNRGADGKDAEQAAWRRITSSENVGIAGTLVGAADTVAQFAMHATPEGMVGLGAMVLSLASLGLAKAEKMKAEKKQKEKP